MVVVELELLLFVLCVMGFITGSLGGILGPPTLLQSDLLLVLLRSWSVLQLRMLAFL